MRALTPSRRVSRIAVGAARVRADIPLAALDVVLCAASYWAMIVLRFDMNVPEVYWHRFSGFLPLAILCHVGANWTWGLYGQIWRHASVAEARRVVLAGLSATVLLLALVL